MQKTRLRKYAQVLATCGVNIQPGQEVIIYAALDQPEFVKLLVEECYKRKASRVTVEWSYQPLEKIHVRYRTVSNLSRVEEWEKAKLQHQVDTLPCTISLISEDPDGLKGLNFKKLGKARRKKFPIINGYRSQMENRYQWCVAAVPGPEWAKKLFPGCRASVAMEKMWAAILDACRIGDDPVGAWERWNQDMQNRCDYLNTLGAEKLHYRSANGTDLTIGMNPRAKFIVSGMTTLQGTFFLPNIPSEELLITPMKGVVDGIAYATKPLSYQGQLIENFWIRFADGKAVECFAEQNQKLLEEIIATDEGSAQLGEVALVPYDSPICQSGILYYNTLFDENAACHLALGRGYTDSLEGYETMTYEECIEAGVNDSMIHVDFMIGSADLSIEAICKDGSVVPVFKDGNWAF